MQTMGRNSAFSNNSQNLQVSNDKPQISNLANTDQRRKSNNVSPIEHSGGTLVSKQHLSRVAVKGNKQNKSQTVPEMIKDRPLSKGSMNQYEYVQDIKVIGAMDNIPEEKLKIANNIPSKVLTPQSGIDVSHPNLQPMIFANPI